jgi:hypothetical protein
MPKMTDLCHPETVRVAASHQAEAEKIAAELGAIARSGMVLPGSITQRRTRCGRRNCGCHADPPRLHGPYWQWARKVYFAALEDERETVRERKQFLVATAEELASSTDWVATAAAYRELMASWKEAGRADRATEDELWKRFRTAQSTFFDARSAAMSAKDSQLRERATAKEGLLAEAERLLPVTDAKWARTALRSIHQRWDKIGAVAKEAAERLEGGLRRVDEAVRKAEDIEWRRTNPEALSRARDTVGQIRKTIGQLEGQLAKATERGGEAACERARSAIATRQSWLSEAEKTLADLTG